MALLGFLPPRLASDGTGSIVIVISGAEARATLRSLHDWSTRIAAGAAGVGVRMACVSDRMGWLMQEMLLVLLVLVLEWLVSLIQISD